MPKTLLLAGDSVTIQRVIELTFTHEDVRVISVSDGRRALQWLESEWPDIVLADVDVPEVDGYALAAHVKASSRLKHVPVLLLAGAFEPVDQARVAKLGCDGVLIKPFEPQQLVSRVKELLARPVPMAPAVNGHGGRDQSRSHGEPATVATFPSGVRTNTMDSGVPALQIAHDFEDLGGTPEPLEPPVRPVWEIGGTDTAATPRQQQAAVPPKVSLVSAFSALLAAEQSTQPLSPASTAAPITEATVEDAVRRVLVRMTDELVRRIVVETAERLIREEIEKIKSIE